MIEKKKIRVLVALSGGIDSSVSAALLVKAGYDVTTAYMINYDDKKDVRSLSPMAHTPPPPSQGGFVSCWVPEYRDAVRVAAKLNIPILKLDFTKEYKKKVLDYMFSEYKAGRTPNPDVLCNKYIKFGVWMRAAQRLGFDYLATGHYARLSDIRYQISDIRLLEAKDKNKDQTYFLHQLTQQQLGRVMFPIGEYTKPQVRQLAKKFKLPTAEKAESMGICFVGEVPMKEFLETRIKHKPGKIVLSDGTVVGKHEGLAFYTIGQRHSLPLLSKEGRPSQAGGGLPSIATNGSRLRTQRQTPLRPPLERGGDSKPLYVLAKRPKTNELVVGFEDDPLLYKNEIVVTDVNWTSGRPPQFPLQCEVRLRHRQTLQPAEIRKLRNKEISIVFAKPQRAVTPGQFAVFYSRGECLGGGVIA